MMLAAAGDLPAQEASTAPCAQREIGNIRTPKAEAVTDDRGELAFKINANETWRRTDVRVVRGQKITVSAWGDVRWAQDGAAWTFVTPDGTVRPQGRHFPNPDAGLGSLVVRIGKGVYSAGSSTMIEAMDEGSLEFMVNDDVLGDNSGHFFVKVNVWGDGTRSESPQPGC